MRVRSERLNCKESRRLSADIIILGKVRSYFRRRKSEGHGNRVLQTAASSPVFIISLETCSAVQFVTSEAVRS